MPLLRVSAVFGPCFALALFALLAASCDSGGDGRNGAANSTSPSVVSGTPAPSTTPTPPPADPTLAEDLRYRGDFDGAAAVYASVAASNDGPVRSSALLGQAQMFLRDDQLDAARIALETLVNEAGAAAEGSTGQYLLASTLDDLGEDLPALDLYGRYASSGGVLTPYANIERAKLLAALARPAEAEALASTLIADPALADLHGSFAMSMGRAYASAGLQSDALTWFTRARAFDGFVTAGAAAAGEAKQALGDPTWINDYLAAIADNPESASAASMLDALDAAAVPVGDYVRGVVEYRAFRNDAARASLERALAAGDNPSEAAYYLGALDERAGDDASAIARYQQSYDLNPQSLLADNGLWWRARLLEAGGRYDEALGVYQALAAMPPNGDAFIDDAAFRAGLVHYRAGRYAEAAATWATQTAAPGVAGFRARLWQGVALRADGDSLGDAVLQLLADDVSATGNYYALRAEVLLGRNAQQAEKPDLERTPDWDAITQAVAPSMQTTGTPQPAGESAAPPVDVDADPRWSVVDQLQAVGLRERGDDVIVDIIDGAVARETLVAVARKLYDQRDHRYAQSAGFTLTTTLPGGESPSALLPVVYQNAYHDLVREAAESEDLDPLVILAVMRQESLYDPDVGSTAGALGLMQIIPETGAAIATERGMTDFETSDLFRPEVAIPFGAHYLSGQLDALDGNLYYTFAAYNGGPGAAQDALELAGNDVDLFVEELEFAETNLYVRRVMEHYARYRQAYGGLDRPSLPQ